MNGIVVNGAEPDQNPEVSAHYPGSMNDNLAEGHTGSAEDDWDLFEAMLETGRFRAMWNGSQDSEPPLAILTRKDATESDDKSRRLAKAEGGGSTDGEQATTQQPKTDFTTHVKRIVDALNAVTAERKTKPRNYDTYRAMKYDLLGLILAALADVKAEIKAAGPVESVKLVDLKSSVLNPAFKNRIFYLKIHKGPKANSTEELWEMVRGKVKPIMLSKALKSLADAPQDTTMASNTSKGHPSTNGSKEKLRLSHRYEHRYESRYEPQANDTEGNAWSTR